MLKLRNGTIEEFERATRGKKIICFGALIMPASFCKANPQYRFEERITFLSDNDPKKWGKQFSLDNGISREIISPEKLRDVADSDTVIFLTSMYFGAIVEQLDSYPELDGMTCYIYPFMQYDREFSETYELRHTAEPLIPKKIHYFWFGRNPKPDLAIRCIESWKKYCPDYEIMEWNEDNYDVTKNRFMREAYEAKKWGFVPDFARQDIIYQYGGIYFDTDVELIQNIDNLLYNRGFFGFGNYGRINTGGGFAAQQGHPLIANLMEAYQHFSFRNEDGTLDLTTNTMHEEPVFNEYGVKPDDSLQSIEGTLFLPSDSMAPLVPGFTEPRVTQNTITIHHGALSWESEKNRKELEASRQVCMRLRERFLDEN